MDPCGLSLKWRMVIWGVWCLWDVSEEGYTAHLSERGVLGSQFTGGSHGICQPEGASYSLNVVW